MSAFRRRLAPLPPDSALSPAQARGYFKASSLKAQWRLLCMSLGAVGFITLTGLVGALADAWPLIVAGFVAGVVLLAMEWRRWNPGVHPIHLKAGKALVRWIEQQPSPHESAQHLMDQPIHGEQVSEVAREWLATRRSERAT